MGFSDLGRYVHTERGPRRQVMTKGVWSVLRLLSYGRWSVLQIEMFCAERRPWERGFAIITIIIRKLIIKSNERRGADRGSK